MIEVIVNGEPRQVEAGLKLSELLAGLELGAGPVAVERNGRVVSRQRHSEESIEPGDRLEIITLVGGG